ncbi:unnamed protein product, partial [Porites evermanni]
MWRIREVGSRLSKAVKVQLISRYSISFTAARCNEVELTSIRYPYVKRGQYSQVTDEDIKVFEGLLPSRVVTDTEEITAYNVDWLKMVRGASKVLLRPQTTQEVAEILAYCNSRRL